ncbi:hypothetical protein B0T21DRAFT_379068 [Apiosordaria backusii]|uniref:NACHT domain-containing protein n=1 Tax=Apiosordaria backusii TaxID=314023 RepID=A0AA40DHB3_9PEZI|nr:hypothetical protein B0T21DRAFT_379068 [Apiosordaria backusii]
MDPVTSIGLVSAILSFVTFGSKLIKGGVEIHREGNLSENATLEDVITRMDSFHSRLVLKGLPKDQVLSDDEKDLRDLAEDCHHISTDLLRLLKNMKRPDSKGLQAARGTVAASWRSVIHGKDRAELEGRLDRCYGRLTTILVWSTKFSVDNIATSAQGNSIKLDRIQTSIDELKHVQQESAASSLAAPLDGQMRKMVDLQEGIMRQIHHIHYSRVLQALQYSGMNYRRDGLSQRAAEIDGRQKDFGGPFRWMCEDEVDDVASDSERERAMKHDARRKFANWLSSEGGIFHVAGKFGLGKSTLMQLLFHHASTQAELEKWAGFRNLVKVNYYFSTVIGGAQQQLTGLSKTLLHDILRCCPDLAPVLLPKAWDEVQNLPQEAVVPEIDGATALQALNQVFHDAQLGSKCFCLFIDGLDEYQDPDGCDQADLVDMLYKWAPAGQSNVKLCVASREETAFFNKFAPELTIRLHDLTRYDMERFVEERLQKVQDVDLKKRLIQEIPQKAEGVFLWTKLVVGEIREDLAMGDGTHLDLNTLDRFPAGLRPLLDRTVAAIPERYRRNAYLVFAILPVMERHMIPCSAIALSFIHDYCKDPKFAYTMAPSKWETRRVAEENHILDANDERVDRVSVQLRTWCKGLVEVLLVHVSASARKTWGKTAGIGYGSIMQLHQVYFSHRTISEYFQEAIVQEALLKSGVTWETVVDAISQILLAEFCHSGPFSHLTYGGWMRELLFLRRKYSLDTPPFAFLERLQYVMNRRKVAMRFVLPEQELERRLELNPEEEQDPRQVRGVVLVGKKEIGTVAMGEVSNMPWWDGRVTLWGPFFTAIKWRKFEYPRWKVNTDHDPNPDIIKIAATLYLAFDVSHTDYPTSNWRDVEGNIAVVHRHCDFVREVLIKYQTHLNTKTSFALGRYARRARTFKHPGRTDLVDSGECLTIWQHYIVLRFRRELGRRDISPFPEYRSYQSAEQADIRQRQSYVSLAFSRTLETFLQLGADPRLLITLRTRERSLPEESEQENQFLFFEFGDEENRTTWGCFASEEWQPGLEEFCLDKRPISLRDWIARSEDLPNKDALLAQIDQRLAEYGKGLVAGRDMTLEAAPSTTRTSPEATTSTTETPELHGKALPSIPLGYLISFLLGVLLSAMVSVFL